MDLLLINFLSFHQELPHDILCISRSDDNRRAAGPLDFQHSEFILLKQILQRIDGPAARHFGVFCVFCGLSCG